jgi:hypothetical protein
MSLLDLPTFLYDKSEVYGILSASFGGMMVLSKNDTFAHVQMYDRNLIQLGVSKLSKAVNITFKMPADILAKYYTGTINLSCASRDSFS